LVKSGPGSRVVVVSSGGHRWSGVRFDDPGFDDGKAYDPWKAYGQSKTANILCARTFSEKYGDKGVEFYSVHPGKRIQIWLHIKNHRLITRFCRNNQYKLVKRYDRGCQKRDDRHVAKR
jgi:NAD(P)-dependent dehydrogenase (short-subunit alcohol dehydrogenase family)